MKSPTATDDTYWFLATCGNADMTFGIPAAIARDMARQCERDLKTSPKLMRRQIEEGIHSVMKAEQHVQPQYQQPFAFVITKLCMTCPEAKADPAARGIQLETTTNPVPSWFGGGVTITSVDPTKADGRSMKWNVFYRTLPGGAEIDALVKAHRARRS